MAQVTKRSGGVTAAQGFQAIGIAAGIKKKRKDMAMIYSAAQCDRCSWWTEFGSGKRTGCRRCE